MHIMCMHFVTFHHIPINHHTRTDGVSLTSSIFIKMALVLLC